MTMGLIGPQILKDSEGVESLLNIGTSRMGLQEEAVSPATGEPRSNGILISIAILKQCEMKWLLSMKKNAGLGVRRP